MSVDWQLSLQLPGTGGSHASPAAISTTPLPQLSFDLQSAEQPSPSLWLPSSQASPAAVSVIPLPHVSFDLQFAEQPSPSLVLPSSQISFLGSAVGFPAASLIG